MTINKRADLPNMASIEQTLQQAQQQLIAAGLDDSPRLDAEILLCHALGKERTYLFTWPDKELDEAVSTSFFQLLKQRLDGHPIAHITAHREFWGLDLEVSADTLIPRPDTEILVEITLQLPLPRNANILDMGTGTGAIALALKSEQPNWHIKALDFSLAALDVAKKNAQKLQLEVAFQHSNWFQQLNGEHFDCIVSNPPYIEEDDIHLQEGDVRFEPITALTSGTDGLDDIRLLIASAADHLNENGWLLLEHGYNQAQTIRLIFKQHRFNNIQTIKDYGGNDRVTMAQVSK